MKSGIHSSPGFSLVEVALALGIVSFCLLAIFGLLAQGMNLNRESRDAAAASRCLEQIAASIRGATASGSNWTASAGYTNLTWSLGGSAGSQTFSNLNLAGTPSRNLAEARLSAFVELQPPADASSPGSAFVSVAWPAASTWNPARTNWTKSQGSVSTRIIFLPTP
jgi:Tfp pilus assembly protein PilV